MATYWKSQPKKHCDFCKCWIADNKPSIDFHERGKRHKENVEKKLTELRKKGLEQYKIQQTLDQDLVKMEVEALKAFKKDLANDPALAAEFKAKAASAAASAANAAKRKEELLQAARNLHKQGLAGKKQPGQTASSSTPSATASATPSAASTATTAVASSQAIETSTDNAGLTTETEPQCIWLEGTSPEGDMYYWNSVTGESQWEKPEGYVATTASTVYKEQGAGDNLEEAEQVNSAPNIEQKADTDAEQSKVSQKLVPPGMEDEEPKESEDDDEEEEEDEKEEEEEEEDEKEEEQEERTEATQRPAKRKMTNPYGSWATVVPDDTPPVDLQLPQPDRPYFQPIVPQAAQFQPRERIKFKERTISTLSTSSSSSLCSGQTSFKKRKFGGGGRSIRQRDEDT